jgi:N-carbamoyl-L-amino-acid hydrolase
MARRKDAMPGASELVLAVERVARGIDGQQVATVGRIRAEPGAPNVIPGRVTMSLEIRDLRRARIDEVLAGVRAEAGAIARRRGLAIAIEPAGVDLAPALSDPRVRGVIAAAARELGLSQMVLPSGAGHDAQEIAVIAPMGMIFVPSVGGISHSPREFTRPADMANGAAVLLRTVLALDDYQL